MDMVERVSRALCARLGRDPDELGPSVVVTKMGDMGMAATFNGPLEPAWKSYEGEARAAIEAIRDFDFANSPLWEIPFAQSDIAGQFEDRWKRLFDAALTPPPSGQEM